MSTVNRRHKDRLFGFLFGNEAHRDWTLSLYNAVSGSSHSNPDDILITTISDVIYMGMKALEDMPDDFLIRSSLLANRAEVKNMCITEYNEVETMQMFKEQGRKEGRNEVAESMIKANESGDKIVQYTGLKKEDVDKLARNLHIVLAWNNKNQ